MIVIGHRGTMDYEPQNTLSAFELALKQGANAIEFDVQITKDGKLVVYHDETLDTLTDGEGSVAQRTLAELKKLRVKHPNLAANSKHRKRITIPTLEETLDLVGGYSAKKIWANAELKIEGIEHEFNEFIKWYMEKNNWPNERSLVSSFYHQQLMALRQVNEKLRIGALFDGVPVDYNQFIMALNPYSSNPNIDSVNQALVDDAHRRNLKVYVWTVTNYEQAKKVISLAVDGVFANSPKKMREWQTRYHL